MSTADTFTLRLKSGRTLSLRDGVTLKADDLLGVTSTRADGVVAEVSPSPHDPSVLGLMNQTRHAWSATLSDGSLRQVDPGKSIKLADGTALTIASTRVAVRQRTGGFVLSIPTVGDIPLKSGTRLKAGELLGVAASPTGVVAEVGRHPKDPAILGLRNLTNLPWSARLPDGSQRRVEPGKSISLTGRTTITFSHVEATIEEPIATPGRRSLGLKPYFDEQRAQSSAAHPVRSTPRPEQRSGFDWQNFRPDLLSSAVAIGFAVLTRSVVPVIISMLLVGGMRHFGQGIDRALSPFWRLRDVIPRPLRMGLGWIVPIGVGYLMTASPTLQNGIARLPFGAPEISVFTATAVIAAPLAYFLVREPQRGATS
ncbi:MAG: hypothetical protein ABJA98_10125 [Acidobacteriota bacterium]